MQFERKRYLASVRCTSKCGWNSWFCIERRIYILYSLCGTITMRKRIQLTIFSMTWLKYTYKQLQVDSIRLYSQLIVLVFTQQTDGLTWAIEQPGQTIFRTFQSEICVQTDIRQYCCTILLRSALVIRRERL